MVLNQNEVFTSKLVNPVQVSGVGRTLTTPGDFQMNVLKKNWDEARRPCCTRWDGRRDSKKRTPKAAERNNLVPARQNRATSRHCTNRKSIFFFQGITKLGR